MVKGCQQLPKTHGNCCEDRDLLCVGAVLEVWHVINYTRGTHTIICMMTFLTDKTAQWANWLKIMVTHRIYINDRDICKHLSFLLMPLQLNLCAYSQSFISELEIQYMLG